MKDAGHDLVLRPSDGAVIEAIEDRELNAVPIPRDGLTVAVVQPWMTFQLQTNPRTCGSQPIQPWALVMPLLDHILQSRLDLRQVTEHNGGNEGTAVFGGGEQS